MRLTGWIQDNCKFLSGARSKPPRTVSIAAFREKDGEFQVLVGLRSRNPEAGKWALPGGHVDEGEKLVEAARRELKEETALDLADLIFVEKKLRKIPSGERIDTIFCAKVKDGDKARAGSDLKDTKWVSAKDPPDLAFNHAESIRKALEILSLKKQAGKDDQKGKRGLLVVFEGPDGSGKSTQVNKLVEKLEDNGYPVSTTKWASSKLLKKTIRKAKDKRILTPKLYSLLNAADLIYRYEHEIEPSLSKNEIVICDRYDFTSFARDGARGIDKGPAKKMYEDLRRPDLVFHCKAPVSVAAFRLSKDKGLSYYGAGLDLGLAPSKDQSCIKYLEMMDKTYNEILPEEDGYVKLDMTQTINQIHREVVREMNDRFGFSIEE